MLNMLVQRRRNLQWGLSAAVVRLNWNAKDCKIKIMFYKWGPFTFQFRFYICINGAAIEVGQVAKKLKGFCRSVHKVSICLRSQSSDASPSSSSWDHSELYWNCKKKDHTIMSIQNWRKRRRRTRSLPLIPLLFPALLWSSFVFLNASCSASFLSSRVFFHTAKVSGVTGVRLGPSLCLCASFVSILFGWKKRLKNRYREPRLPKILPYW